MPSFVCIVASLVYVRCVYACVRVYEGASLILRCLLAAGTGESAAAALTSTPISVTGTNGATLEPAISSVSVASSNVSAGLSCFHRFAFVTQYLEISMYIRDF